MTSRIDATVYLSEMLPYLGWTGFPHDFGVWCGFATYNTIAAIIFHFTVNRLRWAEFPEVWRDSEHIDIQILLLGITC
jgi:hypothetical protein